MKRIYKAFLILIFIFFGIQSLSVQASCCNAGFSTPKISSSAKNWFRFVMHDSVASDIQSVWWSFGDSTYSNERTPYHAYYESGDYSVTLTVIKKSVNGIQKSCTETHVLSVVYECTDFTYTTSNLNASFIQIRNFHIDSAWVRGRNYTWVFGDGSISHETNPKHTYTKSGAYNVCLYQNKLNASGIGTYCSSCHTVVVTDTTPPVCHPDFSYSLTDTLVFLHSNSMIGNSSWWIQGDTATHIWGNDAAFAITTKDSFTVCHRQYTDSLVGPLSAYCVECNTIRPTPHDSIVSCNADFTYTLTDSTIVLDAVGAAHISLWNYFINGSSDGTLYDGDDITIPLPANGEIKVCHMQYNNPYGDSCYVCKVVRERQDTIPAACYSNFGYTINGATVTAHVDSTSSGRHIWAFANDAVVYDTLLASYTFTSPGTKRICQTTFMQGAVDSCTTCKDVIIEAADINIHPNPAVNQITVKSQDGTIASIDIYDINGLRVKSISGLNVVKYVVNVSDLISGIYYVSSVLTDGRTDKTKIIIQ